MTHDTQKFNFSEKEKKILEFWRMNRIFEKSIAQRKKGKTFVFYEGPPTANGMPHIGHALTRAFKDVVLRYKTMRGFYVPRRAGWDTHGLPVEIEIEKELGLATKSEIEKYGVAAFNKKAKESVWRYKEEWEKFTKRIGFWIDFSRPYITYETSYIETLWRIIKEFWKKKLLYEDFKVLPWCARCGTGLSSHEMAQGYKEVDDTAVYVKFKIRSKEKTYILSWTTTPWTLPGNVALAIGEKIQYVRAQVDTSDSKNFLPGETYIFARNVKEGNLFGTPFDFGEDGKATVHLKTSSGRKEWLYFINVEPILGKELAGLFYEPLFDVPELKSEKSYRIYSADFVTAEEGTGVVHTAVMYGEDDYVLGNEIGLPKFHTVDEFGRFIKALKGFGGMYVKSKETEEKIIQFLREKNALFAPPEKYHHEYPHCWRCGKPLLYYARKSWWVRVSRFRKELLLNNNAVHWVPEHTGKGRFGEFLKEARDWAFSRERYWGTPLPVWKCGECGCIEVIGSVAELKQAAKKLPYDDTGEINLHKPYVDAIAFPCRKKCGGMMMRVPEVADVWFDSGAMPFASQQGEARFPAGNRTARERFLYPADYICEAVDQTRGWFYTLLAVATLLKKKSPYKNVISFGHVLDKNGQKMSKSKGNVVDPNAMMEKYGADALRWYFYTVNSAGETKRFDEKDVQAKLRGFLMILWNCFALFDTYAPKTIPATKRKSPYFLDRWVMARLDVLVEEVTERLEEYDITGAGRMIEDFAVNDFSQWYLRRSRRRFQHPLHAKELQRVCATTATVLLTIARLLAPFTPFIAEALYQRLKKKNVLKGASIHLDMWPKSISPVKEHSLVHEMILIRGVVAAALRIRAEKGIKVRQPLHELQISHYELRNKKELLELIKEEVNVKKITFANILKLDTTITPELKEEGMVREIVRNIQEMRKDLDLKPKNTIAVQFFGDKELETTLEKWTSHVKKQAGAKRITIGGKKSFKIEREVSVDEKRLWIGLS